MVSHIEIKNWLETAPFSLQGLEVFEFPRPDGFRYFSYSINAQARINNELLTGCGEANSLALATTKALAELIERCAWKAKNTESPNAFRNTNGWAAHQTIRSAKEAACFELIKRDSVLHHWFAQVPFNEIPFDELPYEIRKWQAAELARTEFPNLRILKNALSEKPTVICIFSNSRGFGVVSHSTRKTLIESIDAAIAENCRAAHSAIRRDHWSDTIRLRDGSLERVGPGAHSVYYAYHEPFPAWMFGQKISLSRGIHEWETAKIMRRLNDFDFSVVFKRPLIVGYAGSKNILPLRWGNIDPRTVDIFSKTLDIRTENFNSKPHIAS